MITKPQRTRPTLASHRHARCTCAHDMNLLPELRELLHYAACTADPPFDLPSPGSAVVLVPPLRNLPAIKIQNT